MPVRDFLRAAVPGWGQIHARRPGRGLLLFALVALGVNGWAVLPFLWDNDALRWTLLALGAFFWLYAIVDTFRLPGKDLSTPTPPLPPPAP